MCLGTSKIPHLMVRLFLVSPPHPAGSSQQSDARKQAADDDDSDDASPIAAAGPVSLEVYLPGKAPVSITAGADEGWLHMMQRARAAAGVPTFTCSPSGAVLSGLGEELTCACRRGSGR